MARAKPLDGIKVVDFSAVYAGPICGRMLSDCGADVIKVEPPGSGDQTRGPTGGVNRIFVHFNAGKRSVAINLASEEGRALARRLVDEADVVIENYRPGVMARFGLDYASLKDARPDLVYCSISGFGQTGPYAQHGAYAPIAHAASGFDAVHRGAQPDPEAPPPNWSIMIADMLTGSYAFGGVQTALIGRLRTGLGDYVDVTMMEAMMMLIPGQIQTAQTGEGRRLGGFRPIRVRDGFVMVCIVSDKNFAGLCEATGRPELLEDPRFVPGERFKNMDDFVAAIESWSLGLSALECEERLNACGVPASLYNDPEDLMNHPQLEVRGAFKGFVDDDGEFLVQNAPFRFAEADVTTTPAAPALGQHTDEVLAERLALDADALGRLRAAGAIA